MRDQHTKPRTLADIEEELSYALPDETRNMLRIGRLLNEAKARLDEHGEWLKWLRRHTAMSARTAQRYMAAAAWADAWDAKCDTVSFMDERFAGLSRKAVYLLSSANYSDDVVKKVLEAAASRPVNELDVKDIAESAEAGIEAAIVREIEAEKETADEAAAKSAGYKTVEAWQAALKEEEAREVAKYAAAQAKWEEEQAAIKAKLEAERAAIAAILDGGPDPNLPPPAEPVAAPEFHVSTVEKAIEMLRSVMTKPLDAFAAVTASPDTLGQTGRFLLDLRERRTHRS
jgi:hypothetical protein